MTEEIILQARDTLIRCWDEWDAEANNEAQNEQDNEAWFNFMECQVETVLRGMAEALASNHVK